jgi:hypothetical protein
VRVCDRKQTKRAVWNCLINNPEIISQGMVLVSQCYGTSSDRMTDLTCPVTCPSQAKHRPDTGPCTGQTRAHAQARHRPDTGKTQARHRPDTGPTQAHAQAMHRPMHRPGTGQAQAPTQAASPVLLPVLNRPPHRPKTGLCPPSAPAGLTLRSALLDIIPIASMVTIRHNICGSRSSVR